MKTKRCHARTYTAFALSSILSLAVAALISCGGSTTSSSNPTTTVQTFLSDPPTARCSATYASVWVTITKVQANLSADAGPNDSHWQTLVDLTSDPKQVDLLALYPSPEHPDFCGTLYMLAKQQLPPGMYQQIRLILLANNASVGPSGSDNHCNSAGYNCVVPKDASGKALSPVELQLPSEAQTGIKIPASQIANGGLTVTEGQNTDLNLDINTCASIVKAGKSGRYLLKPVLHAGEVSINQSVISGRVIEGANAPNPGSPVADAIVLLEQQVTEDSTTTDRVIMTGTTAPDGTFSFCPLAATDQNVDIVVAGQTTESSTTTTTYNPTVLFNVPIGSQVGDIPIYAETATSGTPLAPAMISGQISTAGDSGAVTGTVQVSALQQVSNGGNAVNITVPVLQADSTPTGDVTPSQPPVYMTDATVSPGGCATTSADCVAYSLQVPASSPAIGTYSGSSNSFTAPDTTDQASYTVNAVADGSDSLLSCSPTSMTSESFTVKAGDTASSITTPAPTVTVTSLEFDFTGCTVPSP